MSTAKSGRRGTAALPSPREAIETIRQALSATFGAERRLRGRDHFRAGELTYAQVRTLVALSRERAMTAGELARSADLNPASVTAMLDQLEAANIVQRQRSAADRRVCNVSLTEEGWEILERKRGRWQALWEERLAGFSDAELETAARIMREIAALYDALATSADGDAA